jgi:hypothetical protein
LSTPTTPPLFGCLILSRDSYEQLKGFFRGRSVELDRASGFELHLIDVGNPVISREFYELARAEAARIGDTGAAQMFAETQQAENADTHRLRVMDKLAAMLAVSPAQRPCIALVGPGKFETIATFPLEPTWYSTQEALSAFGGALKEWIAELEVLSLLGGRAALAGELQAELDQLRRRLV